MVCPIVFGISCANNKPPYNYSSVPDHKGFHGPTVDHDSPVLFSILAHPDNKVREEINRIYPYLFGLLPITYMF